MKLIIFCSSAIFTPFHNSNIQCQRCLQYCPAILRDDEKWRTVLVRIFLPLVFVTPSAIFWSIQTFQCIQYTPNPVHSASYVLCLQTGMELSILWGSIPYDLFCLSGVRYASISRGILICLFPPAWIRGAPWYSPKRYFTKSWTFILV